MSDYEMETSWTVWNNKHGTSTVIKPDGDGLGLIEIKQEDSSVNFTLTVEEAKLVAAALLNAAAAQDVKDRLVA